MRPALIVRLAVSLAALVSFGAGVIAYTSGRVAAGPSLPLAGVLLILIAAMTRRYGIALPGNGFSSYVIGVMLFAILDRGWAFAAIVAPFAMLVGDVLLRRLPLRSSLDNAAHLTTGSTLVGLMYARTGGEVGAGALAVDNLAPLALTLVLLPIIVNGTFYLELALGQTIAWVDARLTMRWEAIIYLVSARPGSRDAADRAAPLHQWCPRPDDRRQSLLIAARGTSRRVEPHPAACPGHRRRADAQSQF